MERAGDLWSGEGVWSRGLTIIRGEDSPSLQPPRQQRYTLLLRVLAAGASATPSAGDTPATPPLVLKMY